MRITWNPSPAVRSLAKYVATLRKSGMTWEKISDKTGKHFTYCHQLNKWYVENVKNQKDREGKKNDQSN